MFGIRNVDTSQDISNIFKEEYSNLVAVLSHYYKVHDIQLAEDIVSETFIKAMKTWSHKGTPESPKACLRKTAKNILIDNQRRKKTFEEKVVPNINNRASQVNDFDITDKIIEDSQLRMIFHVCNPILKSESQICLSLRVLCSFNIESIAIALLSNKETINKKLYRAKKTLKEVNDFKNILTNEDYLSRLDNVLRIIYLIFNEGYYSTTSEQNIKYEICWEAMQLCKFLTNQEQFPKAKIHALLALMCFHSSRLQARESDHQLSQLYQNQDKEMWDKRLIQQGEKFLNLSAVGDTISKYHIEAAIAYWHTTEDDSKWNNILQLYNKLLIIEYSPVIAMNRTYALAMANSIDEAIIEALKINLTSNHYYFCLLAELYKLKNNIEKEKQYLNKAYDLAVKSNEKMLIKTKLKNVGKS